ncbi:MAG: hypothetical protein KGL68_03105 [Burkholderiales bacterium]|nr:hypothetical protein [Burkholderiales bacterium]
MVLPPKKIIQIDLVRKAGPLAMKDLATLEHHMRTLLAPFKLGRRLDGQVVLQDETLSIAFLLECSGQMGLGFGEGSVSAPEHEFQREAQAVEAFLRSTLDLLYEQASSLRATPYDVSSAVERAQALGVLKDLCWSQEGVSSGAAAMAYPEGQIEEFRLSAMPGRLLAQVPVVVSFYILAVGVSRIEIRHARGSVHGGRSLPPRASVQWDAALYPDVSAALFRLMHEGELVSLPLFAVIKPTGVVNAYHLAGEAVGLLTRSH